MFRLTAPICLILTQAFLTDSVTSDSIIDLNQDDVCSNSYKLPSNGSTYYVVGSNMGGVNFSCTITLYAEDKASSIRFTFDDTGSYISSSQTSFTFSDSTVTPPRPVLKYTSENSSEMDGSITQIGTNRLSLTVLQQQQEFDNDWQILFHIKSVDGPLSGYPFSIAFGVVALCVAATVAVTVLLLCICCCCCCKKRRAQAQQQIVVRRRTRMITQLRKEGYSVTRDYGATADTAPLIQEQGMVAPPQARGYHPHRLRHDTSHPEYDPPPSYDSIQPYHRLNTTPGVNARQPTVVSNLQGATAPDPPQPNPVAEAVLIVLDMDTTPTPPIDRPAQDLMRFEPSPANQVRSNVDLLCNESEAPPAFGAVE